MGFFRKMMGRRGQPPEQPGGEGRKGDGKARTDCTISMVDFMKEHQYIISLGLASEPRDINAKNWYRIVAANPKLVRPGNLLRLKNPRLICGGKLEGLGCDGVIQVTNPLLPSPDGSLQLNMKGVLDAPSKCRAVCSCGSSYLLSADATQGRPGEAYLMVTTVDYPAARRLALRPFFETDGVDIVGS
jgi:hypothetical protein